MIKPINNVLKVPFSRLNEEIQTLQSERKNNNENKALKNMTLKESLKEFESLFVFYMLKEMNKSSDKEGLFGKGLGNDFFRDMFNQEVSRSLSKSGGIGIADFIEKSSNMKVIKSNNKIKEFFPSLSTSSKKVDTKVNINQIVSGGKISSHFGIRNDPFTGEIRFHDGIDVACPEGTKIFPLMPGKVLFSGQKKGYGNIVILEHQNGAKSYYAHNKINFVKIGDIIDASSPIGLTGKTGRSTGPHLHFELREGNKPQNPEKYIKIG